MKNILKQYLSKHLTCPFGKVAAKEDIIHYVDHRFLSDTKKIDQAAHIEEYKKFLLDRRVNTSLIVVLENTIPLDIEREKLIAMDTAEQKDAIAHIQQHLYTALGDVILWFDMANKNCKNIEEWSNKPGTCLPAIDMMHELYSGGGMEADDFIDTTKKSMIGYKRVPIIQMEGCNTEVSEKDKKLVEEMRNITCDIPFTPEQEQYRRELRSQNWYLSSFLMFYMGPLYPENHARYAPKHNIVINNNEDISSIKSEYREEVMKKIQNQSDPYDVRYFPLPV